MKLVPHIMALGLAARSTLAMDDDSVRRITKKIVRTSTSLCTSGQPVTLTCTSPTTIYRPTTSVVTSVLTEVRPTTITEMLTRTSISTCSIGETVTRTEEGKTVTSVLTFPSISTAYFTQYQTVVSTETATPKTITRDRVVTSIVETYLPGQTFVSTLTENSISTFYVTSTETIISLSTVISEAVRTQVSTVTAPASTVTSEVVRTSKETQYISLTLTEHGATATVLVPSVSTFVSTATEVYTQPAKLQTITELHYSTLTQPASTLVIVSTLRESLLSTPTETPCTTTSTSTISWTITTTCTPGQVIAYPDGKTTTLPTPSVSSYVSTSVTTFLPSSSTSALPVPPCLPNCLDNVVAQSPCSNQADTGCYCKSPSLMKEMIACISSADASSSVKKQAISYLQGICAPYLAGNPAIITAVPASYAQIPVQSSDCLYSTLSLQTILTEPCTMRHCSSPSTVLTISTNFPVPIVSITSSSISPGSVSYGLVPSPTPSAHNNGTTPFDSPDSYDSAPNSVPFPHSPSGYEYGSERNSKPTSIYNGVNSGKLSPGVALGGIAMVAVAVALIQM